ncbi:MAG: alpha/beta fold hydrolase [Lentisphaerae bacterium]|jgi:cephalosporin-C deacetylase-like acetyl esterase|nr:alpha/beta fold hydrolase [Lentisphaerota bacterium]MBT5611939.1 alpha/beta fold hydrolase [Lentisphaerota bacterium]MBT7057907.1 alpha/beta fold hydrolase [Lentisphaerota bacterium]MBT7843706.1 alpha/beta fold hydrolase [Lentisphaerota bacterium]
MNNRLLAPPLAWFDDWMSRAGEPIPDFAALPSRPELPDLLRLEDGSRVVQAEDWPRRRGELRALVQHWLIGTWPEPAPEITAVSVLREERGGGVTCRQVELTFAGPTDFSFDLEVMVPDGVGPFPVFLTQSNHRRWAALGASRGYLCCVYPGADVDDQSAQLADVYPDHDWSQLARRAWLGCRALDYVLTLPVADPAAVGITGHSRNGKQSLIAAAMDERFSAVISSSSGSGGVVPWRCSSEFCFQESVEFMTRQATTQDWFHPRIRLFTGREDRLPIDTHALLGLIAPRACLVSDAMTDGCGSMFGVEMSVNAGRRVYRLLGEDDRLSVMWRWGNHETDAQVIGRYFDWFDTASGRAAFDFPQTSFFRSCAATPGAAAEGEPVPPASASAEERVHWLLGDGPPCVRDSGGGYGKLPEHRAAMVGLGPLPEGIGHLGLSFSEYISGDLFFPMELDEPLTPVIWLHPFSHSYGTAGAYMGGAQVFHALAQQGYAVLAFTQLGAGQRVEEGRDFYQRYPTWSKMGKMVRDVRAAVNLLTGQDLGGSREPPLALPLLDTERVTVLGYSLGGLVALLAGACDDRIAAVASFCGAVPFREHELHPECGAMQRFWQLPDLLRRLAQFAGCEESGPVALADVFGLIAPRPCLVVAPQFDREIDARAVARSVENSGPGPGLTFLSPADYNRFQVDQHRTALEWLAGVSQ